MLFAGILECRSHPLFSYWAIAEFLKSDWLIQCCNSNPEFFLKNCVCRATVELFSIKKIHNIATAVSIYTLWTWIYEKIKNR